MTEQNEPKLVLRCHGHIDQNRRLWFCKPVPYGYDPQCLVEPRELPIHHTEAGYPDCATCDGGGCPDCTDPA